MAIRNGKDGDIVWMSYGLGPKAVIVERRDLRGKSTPIRSRSIYYKVKVLEESFPYIPGDLVDCRAKSLSRVELDYDETNITVWES